MTHKMASTSKERFDAAIKVIHSLPKDGPFQPSNEMMLTFYGYYKQATEGPCTMSKPSFWEVVKKAKWEAWHKLGNMDRPTAMDLYVEELKKTLRVCTDKWNDMDQNNDPRIVEAMPQTGVVSSFMQTLGTFYELVDEEPPMKGVTRPNKTSPNTPTSAFENGDGIMDMSEITESALKTYSHVEEDPATAMSQSQAGDKPVANGPDDDLDQENTEVSEELVNGRGDTSESVGSRSMSESEDEFCDTSDNPLETQAVVKPKIISDLGVQMSTPMKDSPTAQRVHFADPPTDSIPNGKISPIPQAIGEGQYVYVPGFPYLSKKVDREISDSMLVSTGDASVNTLSVSQTFPDDTRDFSSNNSSYIGLPEGMRRAEGGEEPEENRRSAGRGQKQGESSSSGRTGSSRGNFSGSGGGRRALLTGGAAGGDGEDNPPQGQSGPPGAVDDQMNLILIRLQQDMSNILDRLNRLETEIRQNQREERSITNRFFRWWPFSGSKGRSAFFILVWPVIVHLVLSYLFRRRRRNR